MAHSTAVYLIPAEANFYEPKAALNIKKYNEQKSNIVKRILFITHVQLVWNLSLARKPL